MATQSKIEERQFHKIWHNQDFLNELKTAQGDLINVLNPGEYNKNGGGPDFKHARIQIGSLTFVGDVEIDNDYTDWKKHGHNINKNYNKVVLHVTYTNKQKQNYVYTSDGRKVVSVTILDNISVDNLNTEVTLAGNKYVPKKNVLKCSDEVELVEADDRKKFILELGIKRFNSKRKRVFRRLKELKFISELKLNEPVIRYELTEEFNKREFSHVDFKEKMIWNQLLSELVFEALGYSKNKNIMMKLGQNVTLEFLEQFKGKGKFTTLLEAVYFNISGLMPKYENITEITSDYIRELVENWSTVANVYDGKKFDETQWQFLGQRPQNFPTVRISGGAKIVDSIINKNLVGVLIKKFTEINSTKVLINSIRSLFILKATGYWKNHYVFEKSSKVKLNYIIGLGRADEIFVNIILPYLAVYFEMFGSNEMVQKVQKVYYEYEQKSDNKIVKDVSTDLKILEKNKKSIYAQGMIEVYRNYCTKNKCKECGIGEKIFN